MGVVVPGHYRSMFVTVLNDTVRVLALRLASRVESLAVALRLYSHW